MTGFRLEQYAELPSTSDLCIARAKAGEPAGLAIIAATQTAGRGSRGRGWTAPPGNLNLSLLLRPSFRPADAGIFSLLTGIAVAEAIETLLPSGIAPTLKWPNDVLLNGAKLAGILIDAAPLSHGLDWLVIGIGINLRHAPEIPGRVTTTIAAHRAASAGDIAAVDAAHAVLDRLAAWLTTLETTGPAAIHESWLACAHPIGTELTIRTPQSTVPGTFAGLSPAGELLLRVENRIERFNTGEILLRPPGT